MGPSMIVKNPNWLDRLAPGDFIRASDIDTADFLIISKFDNDLVILIMDKIECKSTLFKTSLNHLEFYETDIIITQRS